MRIGLLFDLHVTRGQRREYDGVDRARRGFNVLNEKRVDWTLVGGDLRSLASKTTERVGWGSWHGDPEDQYYRKDFQRVKHLLETELDSPYRVVRGNHDRPLSAFRDVFPADEYPRYWSTREDGVRHVFLDPSPNAGYHAVYQTQNFVSAPQLSMLDRLFDEDSKTPTFVYCHVPLTTFPSIESNWMQGRTGAYRYTLNYPAVQRRLERGETVLVNSGHYSPDRGRAARTVNGVTHVLARHFGGSDPTHDGDLRVLDIDADAGVATVRYHDLRDGSEGEIARIEW